VDVDTVPAASDRSRPVAALPASRIPDQDFQLSQEAVLRAATVATALARPDPDPDSTTYSDSESQLDQ